MTTFVKNGASKRVRTAFLSLLLLFFGYGQMEVGDEPIIGLIMVVAGAGGIVAAVFNPWQRKV